MSDWPKPIGNAHQFALVSRRFKERADFLSRPWNRTVRSPSIHFLDSTLCRLQPFFAFMAVGFWLTGLTGIIRSRLAKRKGVPALLVIGMTGFIALGFVELASFTLIEHAAMSEIRPILSAPVKSVTIDGKLVEQRDHLVDALLRMHGTDGHHSHPTQSFRLLVKSTAGAIYLNLARDSDDPHEYWVFDPVYYATTSNAVAHAFTDALDSR